MIGLNTKIPVNRATLEYIMRYVTPERRAEVLIAEADRVSAGSALRRFLDQAGIDRHLVFSAIHLCGATSHNFMEFLDEERQPVNGLKDLLISFSAWFLERHPDRAKDPLLALPSLNSLFKEGT